MFQVLTVVAFLVFSCAGAFAVDCDKASLGWSRLEDAKAYSPSVDPDARGYSIHWGVGAYVPPAPVYGKPGVRQWSLPDNLVLSEVQQLPAGVNSYEKSGYSGLTANQIFYFQIYTYNAEGVEKVYSNPFAVDKPCQAPPPPAPVLRLVPNL